MLVFSTYAALASSNGDNGIRTRDLCVANAALSQLSYIPMSNFYYIICWKNSKKKIEKRARPFGAHPPVRRYLTACSTRQPSGSSG